jgi:hypothetical protein
MKTILLALAMCISASQTAASTVQETSPPPSAGTQQAGDGTAATSISEKVKQQAADFGETVNQDPRAREFSAGILDPIYKAAEWIGFPMFYWVAFMLMVAGLVSFAGQLVFAKFFLLFRGSLNLREIIADAMGLLISATGLVLTTQPATENSDFTRTPSLVLSATAVGVLLGLVCYWWGQRLEFDAVTGARTNKQPSSQGRARM